MLTYAKEMPVYNVSPDVALVKYFDGLVTAFKYSPQPQCLVDAEGWFVDCNHEWCKLFGYSNADLQKLRWQDVTHPDDIEPEQVQGNAVIAGKIKSYSMEKRYRHKDGHYFPAHLTVVGSTRDHMFSIFAGFANKIEGATDERATT